MSLRSHFRARKLSHKLNQLIRVMAPTLIALSFAGVAHAQGTMDFSGAQTLMGTFKNFTVDRQVEPLVMGSEITGLDDRHAYLKLGNTVARFAFNYLDLPTPTPGFLPRADADGGLSFDPDTLEPRRRKQTSDVLASEDVTVQTSNDAPIVLEKNPIPWPKEQVAETARAGTSEQSAPTEERDMLGPEYVREM